MKTYVVAAILAAGAIFLVASFCDLYSLRHHHRRLMWSIWIAQVVCFAGAAVAWATLAPEH